jgi:hypothetical protein
MNEIDYANIVGPMPNFVSVDLHRPLGRLNGISTFDSLYRDQKQRSDAMLSKIICCLMDRQFINMQIASLAKQYMNEVTLAIENAALLRQEMQGVESTSFARNSSDLRLMIMDDMIVFEQTALDIADIFQQLRLYRHNRFLPYLYETTINPRAVVLTKIDSFEFLCDQIPTLSTNPFMEAD